MNFEFELIQIRGRTETSPHTVFRHFKNMIRTKFGAYKI